VPRRRVAKAFVLRRVSSLVERRLFGPALAEPRQYCSSARRRVEPRGRAWDGSGTLLGPEGSSESRFLRTTPPRTPEPSAQPIAGKRGTRGGYRPSFENYTVDASIFVARQATKGTWWMPWHQEPMKDVGACDKPREVGNRAVIRGFPNGETQLESCPVTCP
jgi:hypothetical protein